MRCRVFMPEPLFWLNGGWWWISEKQTLTGKGCLLLLGNRLRSLTFGMWNSDQAHRLSIRQLVS